MDYGLLIKRSWQLTWRWRWLWVLGLFVSCSADAAGDGGASWLGLPFTDEGTSADAIDPRPLGEWVLQNLALVAGVASGLFAVVLALFVASFIAMGGLIWGAAELARDRPVTAAAAWRRGLHCAWRYVGLWLIQVAAIVVAILALMALFVGAALGVGALGMPTAGQIVVGLLAAVLGAIPALVLAVAFSLVVTYAERAIAIDDSGPVSSIVVGLSLLRSRLGPTTLAWLINIGLNLVASIALGLVQTAIVVPLGMVGIGLHSASGLTPGLVLYGLVALVLVGAGMWLASAVANAYFWTYWTLAFLSLTGRLPPPNVATAPGLTDA